MLKIINKTDTIRLVKYLFKNQGTIQPNTQLMRLIKNMAPLDALHTTNLLYFIESVVDITNVKSPISENKIFENP